MTADEAAVAVIDALDHAVIPFMIVGSLASNFHGIPRATRDADFVVQVGPTSIADLAAALPDGLYLEPQAAFDGVHSCADSSCAEMTRTTRPCSRDASASGP
jgi:hypothetical protein